MPNSPGRPLPDDYIVVKKEEWRELNELRESSEQLRRALSVIAEDPCEDLGHGHQQDRDCLTYYPSDPTNWCPPCIAAGALAPPTTTEAPRPGMEGTDDA